MSAKGGSLNPSGNEVMIMTPEFACEDLFAVINLNNYNQYIMNAEAKNNPADLVNISIKSNGSEIPCQYQIDSVEIDHEINRVAMAKIMFLDGDSIDEEFAVSSSSTFIPGASLEIEAGYGNKKTQVFKGIVTSQRMVVNAEIGSGLEIECHDESVKMTVGKKSRNFNKMTDSAAMSALISDYPLTVDVTSTDIQHPILTQYDITDWDYLQHRAEMNGMVVSTIANKVTVSKPDADTNPVLTITYGDNLLNFDASLDAVTQLAEVKANAWDYPTQRVVSAQASNNYAGPGDLSNQMLSEVIGLSEYQLQTTAPLPGDDLATWAKGEMVKSSYRKIVGTVGFQGSSLAQIGKYLTIKGMGTRFNGNHFVSRVEHHISQGNWTNEATLGLPLKEVNVGLDHAAAQPPIAGMFSGTVIKTYEDPDSQYRILVKVPIIANDDEGIWARLANPCATSGAGMLFLPEVGDEVVLGFMNDDARFPVILGSMYSRSNLKPYREFSPDEQNSIKGIVTKSELRIIFDDENKVLTVTTPGGNRLTLNDQDERVVIEDQNENSIEMSDDGITLKSPKNINIQADQNVTIKGTMGVNIEGSAGDVKVSGVNVKLNADREFSAEGNLTASLQGGTETTVKGGMVMIN